MILDDNFYLKSMRKPYYRHLRKLINEQMNNNLKISYIEFIIKCDLEYAINNNKLRKGDGFIPRKVIERMFEKMEYDSFIKNFVILYPIEQKDDIFMDNFKEKILSNLIYSNILIEELVKSEISNEKSHIMFEINSRFIIFKNEFLKEFEVSNRKKIGDLYKNYNSTLREILTIYSKDEFLKKINSFEISEKNVCDFFYLILVISIFNKNNLIKINNIEQWKETIKEKQISKFISNLKENFFHFIKEEYNKIIHKFETNELYVFKFVEDFSIKSTKANFKNTAHQFFNFTNETLKISSFNYDIDITLNKNQNISIENDLIKENEIMKLLGSIPEQIEFDLLNFMNDEGLNFSKDNYLFDKYTQIFFNIINILLKCHILIN